jgi:hypothetical protein
MLGSEGSKIFLYSLCLHNPSFRFDSCPAWRLEKKGIDFTRSTAAVEQSRQKKSEPRARSIFIVIMEVTRDHLVLFSEVYFLSRLYFLIVHAKFACKKVVFWHPK